MRRWRVEGQVREGLESVEGVERVYAPVAPAGAALPTLTYAYEGNPARLTIAADGQIMTQNHLYVVEIVASSRDAAFAVADAAFAALRARRLRVNYEPEAALKDGRHVMRLRTESA